MPKNERLRNVRIGRNWRQQDVADKLGVALVTIQRWERGFQQPSAYYRAKLSALFGLSAQELGLLEEAPLGPAESAPKDVAHSGVAPSEQIALWTVPYVRNPHFTGRDELLEQLMQLFSPLPSEPATSIHQAALTQAHAIKGLGGVGKTQIAVEYAYHAHERRRYTHTIWVNAASEEALLSSFFTLADYLPTIASSGEVDQRQIVTEIIRWLETCADPWLLIFDNADDLSYLPSYLPSRGNGNILFTTRAGAVGMLASSIEVDCLSVKEAILLLLRRSQRETCASEAEIEEATHIAMALAQFPLALDQAGAYVEETGCSLHDYFQLYQKHRYALLARRGKQATNYPESVATTWSLSFERLEQTNPAAAELLRLCAFLAPDHIPEELLIEGAPHWSPLLQQALSDRFAFNEMLEALLAFSLIKRLAENHLLSLHRLVQVVQRERMTHEEQRLWAERIVCAMNAIIPREPKDEESVWPQCQRYLEQAQACDVLIEEYHLLIPAAVELLERTSTYLCERGLYNLAEPLFWRTLHLCELQVGPEHLKVAMILNGLAQLNYEEGKYAEAEALRVRALRILEQQGQAAYPYPMVIALNGLAFIYIERGKYAQAEPLFQRALRIWDEQVGEPHPQQAFLLFGLATLYAELGKYAEAEPLHLQALSIREQQLGPEHLRVAYSLNALAAVYVAQGRHEEAELLYQRALRIREQRLGSEHFKVSIVLKELANLYTKQGKYAEAESLYLRALRIREQHLGPENQFVAELLLDFANFQKAQGRLQKTAALYQRALMIYEQAFGVDSPMTIDTHKHLHQIIVESGSTKETARPEG